MALPTTDIKEFHWLLDMIQTIDVGLVVLDQNFNVKAWNSFMENHSGIGPVQTKGRNLFDLFPELPKDWLVHKVNSVMLLKIRSFISWEQRPYLFKFKNYRPITGSEPYMYQNVTIAPLVSSDTKVNHIAMIIYDVTDMAANHNGLAKAKDELEILSRTDRLTKLNNRGYWEECLLQEFRSFQRYKTTCSLVMFDIDHFKNVNDTYGHQAGDEVIRQVAKTTRNSLRLTDIAGRYGGEEFVVILTNTDAKSAIVFCERIRKHIEALEVTYGNQVIRFTISLGISQAVDGMESHAEWLNQADQALYASKQGGRNQTNTFQHG
ncbi:MAG: diguanylate cyclase [Candidatus Thiodiazotropha sp.]|jgi:diguanylate cyclase